jgi:exodeoxyribonuclease VII small subunit
MESLQPKRKILHMSHSDTVSFEKAFARLEEILEKMNSGNLALEDSLKLYEEADGLIKLCSGKLGNAEAKIEMLVKNREGNLLMTKEGKPATEPLTSRPC